MDSPPAVSLSLSIECPIATLIHPCLLDGGYVLSNRELHREKVWSRIHLIPLLQAEADRDTYRREVAAKEREAEIMKDVKDWKVGESVYNSKRYTPQSFVVVP